MSQSFRWFADTMQQVLSARTISKPAIIQQSVPALPCFATCGTKVPTLMENPFQVRRKEIKVRFA
eukprot:1844765-Amphidinium_carterae.2